MNFLRDVPAEKRFGPPRYRTGPFLALRATGDLPAAIAAMNTLADNANQKKKASQEAEGLTKWWAATGQQAVEAMEWYQKGQDPVLPESGV